MPVDQTKLDEMIEKLMVKARAVKEEGNNLGRLLDNLNSIQNEEVIDRRTNQKFTATDRQKVYNDNMAEATAIVGQ